jgi:hypothetical protein
MISSHNLNPGGVRFATISIFRCGAKVVRINIPIKNPDGPEFANEVNVEIVAATS